MSMWIDNDKANEQSGSPASQARPRVKPTDRSARDRVVASAARSKTRQSSSNQY